MNRYKTYLKRMETQLGRGTTYDDDLEIMGDRLLPNFRGVYSKDKLPLLRNGQTALVNLDPSDKPGTHWLALYKKGPLFVYDSFGRNTKDIFPELLDKYNVIDTDHKPEQKKSEDNCGQRCLAALLLMKELGPLAASKII